MTCDALLSTLSPHPVSILDSEHNLRNKLLSSHVELASNSMVNQIFSAYLETTPITSSISLGERKIIVDDTLAYLVPNALFFLIKKESYYLCHYVHEKKFISRTFFSSCVAFATLANTTLSLSGSTLTYYCHTLVERNTNLFSRNDSWNFAISRATVGELLEFWHLAQAYKEVQQERSLLSKIYHCALQLLESFETESCHVYNPADDLALAEQTLAAIDPTFLVSNKDPAKIQKIKRCLLNK